MLGAKLALLIVLSSIASLTNGDLVKRSADLPDVLNVKTTNLYPEDGVYDLQRGLLYQSNLWKGQLNVWNPADDSHFVVKIDGVSSSSGDGSQQLAGVSMDSLTAPTKLYAVAKPASAFNFDAKHDQGPCSFHAFNLPLSSTSKPIWSVDVKPVQAQFAQKYGTRPYGNVASAQDAQGNSYMIFALGAPAIAKISADGSSITPWFQEASNESQRPGYTGITFDEATNSLIAYGGPRALTLFKLNDETPTAYPIEINGNFGSLDGTEKIKNFPSLSAANGTPRLLATKAPYIYSFSSTDDWSSVSFKKFTRKEFKTDSLTSIIEYKVGNKRSAYGTGAYFSEGAHGGRKSTPAYKIDKSMLE